MKINIYEVTFTGVLRVPAESEAEALAKGDEVFRRIENCEDGIWEGYAHMKARKLGDLDIPSSCLAGGNENC